MGLYNVWPKYSLYNKDITIPNKGIYLANNKVFNNILRGFSLLNYYNKAKLFR